MLAGCGGGGGGASLDPPSPSSQTSQLKISPAGVNFGNVSVGTIGSQLVTLSNTGTASATITQAVATGAGFSMSGLSLPLTLAVGQNTTLRANFAPTAAGSMTGSISVVSNASNSPATISLSGAGGTFQLTANPSSVNFGNVKMGSSSTQTVTLDNTGTSAVTISQAITAGTGFSIGGLSLPLTLTAGQSASFSAVFSATAAGTSTGSISVVSNASNSPTGISLSGAGSTQVLGIGPASINFGDVPVGSNSTRTVTLSNTSTVSLTVSQASAAGTGFSINGLPLPLTLAAGQSTIFSAIFAPTTAANATGSISVVSNASNSPATISLSGIGGTFQLTANPSSVSFGDVKIGSSSTQTVVLNNTGTSAVTISQASATGTGFSLSGLSLPLTLAAGQSTSFNATFTPTASGNATGSISIISNASNSPATVPLSGNGGTNLLSGSPASLSFGNVTVGSINTLPVVVTSTGSGSVTISQATTTGAGFSLSGPVLPMTLAAGQNTTFSVSFDPTVAGSVSGSVSVVSNATNSPTIESLSGSGVNKHSVALSWAASTSSGVVGYNVYRGAVSGGPYTMVTSSLITATAYTDTTVQAGQTYYYETTAVDSQGAESSYSNQAQAVIPSP